MSYLVDTNVISELRKGRRCHRAVADWWSALPRGSSYLSVLTIGELRRGVESIRRRDVASAIALERWLIHIMNLHEERILDVDREIAEEWARLDVPDPLPAVDGLLAATAKVRGLVLVTRNVADIARTGVAFLNPWDE